MANLLKTFFYVTIFLTLAMMILSHPVKLSPRIAEHEEHVEHDDEHHIDHEDEHHFEVTTEFDQTTMKNDKLLFQENSADSTDFGSSKDKLLFVEKDVSSEEEFSTVTPQTSTIKRQTSTV